MTAPLRIDVTGEHIAKGRPKLSEACAVNLAARGPIAEAFPGATDVLVSGYLLHFRTADDDLMRASLPDGVVAWICKFDRGETVRPLSFTITPHEVPAEVVVAA